MADVSFVWRCALVVLVCVASTSGAHLRDTKLFRQQPVLLQTSSLVSEPEQCKPLVSVHGKDAINAFLLATTPLMPQKSAAEVCSSASACKQLLRPLMTPDMKYTKQCPNSCSGNGICNAGACLCSAAFKGKDCSIPACGKDQCNKHGVCKHGKCFCDPGYTGDHCEAVHTCYHNLRKEVCDGHGICTYGKCFCDPGYTGQNCTQASKCPQDCNNRGLCVHNMCFCHPGYGGPACDTKNTGPCKNSCSGHGKCQLGVCQCDKGYYGADCSKVTQCPLIAGSVCNKRGACHAGQCHCYQGWGGFGCSIQLKCPANGTCSNHGHCIDGQCYCLAGWSGDACDKPSPCKDGCLGRGVCVKGKCACVSGFYGETCERGMGPKTGPLAKGGDCPPVELKADIIRTRGHDCRMDKEAIDTIIRTGASCPNGCSGTGVCLNGTCACVPGCFGEDCSNCQQQCPGNGCNGRGACVMGKCMCLDQYEGADCSVTKGGDAEAKELQKAGIMCSKDCSGHGVCRKKGGIGVCYCDRGYAGAACEVPVPCPDNCHGRGICDRGRCFCHPGFEGATCGDVTRCPEGCNNHGQCFYGKCFCSPYYAGEMCDKTPSCAAGCSLETGICTAGVCVCRPGYTGVDCTKKLQCPNDCSGPSKGVCTLTDKGSKCVCKTGWMGADCSQRVDHCPKGCKNGLCVMGKCKCNVGWQGIDCSGREKNVGIGQLVVDEQPKMSMPKSGPKGGTVPGVNNGVPGSGLNKNPAEPAPSFSSPSPRTAPSAEDLQREENEKDKFEALAEKKPTTQNSKPRFAQIPNPSQAQAAAGKKKLPLEPRFMAANLANKAGTLRATATAQVKSSATSGMSVAQRTTAQLQAANECPNACNKQGICANGVCFCDPGFEGLDCGDVVTCPSDCSGKGICKYGQCYCQPDYTGEDCRVKVSSAHRFPKQWIVWIIGAMAFFFGIIVGRKTVARAGLKFADALQNPVSTK